MATCRRCGAKTSTDISQMRDQSFDPVVIHCRTESPKGWLQPPPMRCVVMMSGGARKSGVTDFAGCPQGDDRRLRCLAVPRLELRLHFAQFFTLHDRYSLASS
jgi:hypothetical protein